MQFDKKQRFSIRKLSLGVCSVLVGIALFGAGHALAEETSPAASQATSSVLAKEEAQTEVKHLSRLSKVWRQKLKSKLLLLRLQ